MARYQYTGPGPDESSGEIIRPGDVREFGVEPDWGPWECLDPEPETAPDPPPATAPAFPVPPITPKGM